MNDFHNTSMAIDQERLERKKARIAARDQNDYRDQGPGRMLRSVTLFTMTIHHRDGTEVEHDFHLGGDGRLLRAKHIIQDRFNANVSFITLGGVGGILDHYDAQGWLSDQITELDEMDDLEFDMGHVSLSHWGLHAVGMASWNT